ncbi:MAG: UDP-N-acetyl-D-glucosamine/UDP-N-acetyl-D-galactosamine dehydrogenase [Clostridiales bacterium]|nr:UDP-N-acetyl-D-glucosamine/UDP-N-acetyl-D-galactosamine dehydrogenase [Clostridiales bacterium]
MGKYVAENTVKKMIQANKQIKGAKVAILGITFKENCPDSRNTKVVDIIHELEEYGIEVKVFDPVANAKEVKEEYGIDLCSMEDIKDIDAVIVTVAHEECKNIKLEDLKKLYKDYYDQNNEVLEEIAAALDKDCDNRKQVLIDVKGIFNRKKAENMNYLYWRL